MADRIQEIMHRGVVSVNRNAPIQEAAQKMRDHEIGDVMVMDNNRPMGMLTDRDIVVNAIARGKDLNTHCGDICSGNLVTLQPNDSLDKAIDLMRNNAIRRIPVMENGNCVGMVSLGDLARERDPNSVLAQVSSAPPNSGRQRPATAK